MYVLNDYARMIADEARTSAYAAALEAVVRPGHVVVDVGAGTGVFAVLACRLGARRVYAIETNDVIGLGPELASSNGCADRIVFMREDALKASLPERADVCVADLRGALPMADDALPILERARTEFLAPGGVLIPASDRLRVAVVSSPGVYAAALGVEHAVGIDLRVMRARLANNVFKDTRRTIGQDALVTDAATWATLDYATVRAAPVAGRAMWTIERAATAHGLIVWFDATLHGEVGYSSAPGRVSVYSLVFLPWSQPIELSSGDHVAVELRVQPEGHPWSWTTLVTRTSASVLRMQQTSFFGATWRPERRG